MRSLVAPRRGSLLCVMAFTALLANAGTWSEDQLLGINANPQKVYNKTWIYRNLALQGEAWCLVGHIGCPSNEVDLKGPGDPNEGYPTVASGGGSLVIASRLTLDNVGDYLLSFQGTATVTNFSDGGMMTMPVYDSASNHTSAKITIPNTITGDAKIVLQFEGVSADFGDLKVMQPGSLSISPNKFTSAAVSHYARAKVIRGMDRMLTNEVSDASWTGSVAANKNSLLGYQHSLKGMLDLAAKVNAHPWVNIPASANDSYIGSFVAELGSNLQAGKIAVVEFSNEPWNSQFNQYFQIANTTWKAAKVAVGRTDTEGNRVVSAQRDASGKVTITLSQPHGKHGNDQVYAAPDSDIYASDRILPQLVTLRSETGGNILVYDTGVVSARAGLIDNQSFNSWVLLDLTHDYVKPLTTFGKPGIYATPYEAKIRYEFTRLKKIYDKVFNANLTDRVRIVKGIRLAGFEEEIYGLAWAKEKYGSIAWLDSMGGGLSPAFYMRPEDGREWNMTSPDAVFYELELAREGINRNLIKLRNMTLAMGQSTINGYEGGPHNDLKPTDIIAAAVQVAHRDDPRMTTLIANSWADWINRGGGRLMYFHAGATDTYDGKSDNVHYFANNTWPLIEGTLTSGSNRVKDDFFTAQQSVSTAPVGVANVTKGDIVLADVHEMLESRGARYSIGEILIETQAKQTSYTFLVTADTARSYTITFDGCSAAENEVDTDTITLLVDGVEKLSPKMPKCANIWTVQATEPAVSAVVPLTAGAHVVEARLGASRAYPVALYRLHFN